MVNDVKQYECDLCLKVENYKTISDAKDKGWVTIDIGSSEHWQTKAICPHCINMIGKAI